MPGNILNADIGFPSFSGSSEQQLGEVKNYLYMLLEQLRYSMGNLDAKNFNQAGLDDLAKIITDPVYAVLHDDQQNIAALILEAEQLSSRLTDAEGNISAVQQTAESITFTVANGSDSSTLTLMRDGVAVKSESISFSGMVSFYDLSHAGSTTINGANIKTGEINAVDIRGVNIYGCDYYDENGIGKLSLTSPDGNFSDLTYKHVSSDGSSYDLFSVADGIGSAELYLGGIKFAVASMSTGEITLLNCSVPAVFG